MFDKFIKKALVNTVAVACDIAEKGIKKATPVIKEMEEKITPTIEEAEKKITPILKEGAKETKRIIIPIAKDTIDFTKNTINEIMEIEIIKDIRNELKAISKRRFEKIQARYEEEKREKIRKLQLEVDALEKSDVELIFLDVEADKTGTKVRELSAIKVLMNFHNKTLNEIDRFERFYDDTREILRDEECVYHYDDYNYDNLSLEDKEEFYNFAKNSKMMVSHNVEYDMKFFKKLDDKKRFCTMVNNIKMTKLETNIDGDTFYKFPKLKETAEFYNIPLNKNMLHTSMYDTYICMKIFEKMLTNNETKDDILYNLLGKKLSKQREEILNMAKQ